MRIWEEVLGVRHVGINDDFFALGGHSLLGIRLFAQIEKELGTKLPVALLFRSPTVKRLAQAIRGDEATPDWSALVPIQAEGSKPPFFCVHGFGGGVLGYAELSRLLGSEQPFYGLQAIGLEGQEEPDARIEDMAARYLLAMRDVQPQGPYYLGGYCYGGVVAFEMARQLKALGEHVALLAVFEGYGLSRPDARGQRWRLSSIAPFLLNLPYWLRDTLQRPGGFRRLLASLLGMRRSSPVGELREWDARHERIIAEAIGDEPDIPKQLRRLMEVHLQAMRDYHPEVYPGRVTLFRVRALSPFRSYDPEMGWGKLATEGVELRMIAGAHYSLLERPHVEVLAASLKQSLEEALKKAEKPGGVNERGWAARPGRVGNENRNGEALDSRLTEVKMNIDEREDTTIYTVVVNHEEQYSIWPADRTIPLGWRDVGKKGTKGECLTYIGQVWTDMRPLSLRKKMEAAEQNGAHDPS